MSKIATRKKARKPTAALATRPRDVKPAKHQSESDRWKLPTEDPYLAFRTACAWFGNGYVEQARAGLRDQLGITWMTDDDVRNAFALDRFYMRVACELSSSDEAVKRRQLGNIAAIVRGTEKSTGKTARMVSILETLFSYGNRSSLVSGDAETLSKVMSNFLLQLGSVDPRFLSVTPSDAAKVFRVSEGSPALLEGLAELAGYKGKGGRPLTREAIRTANHREEQDPSRPMVRSLSHRQTSPRVKP